MPEYKYRIIGDRIREYRSNLRYTLEEGQITLTTFGKKVSQQILIDYMRQEDLPTMGRNTLSDLENGEEKAFQSIPLGTIEGLCQVFGCSVGHLMGEYDSRNYDLQYIHDQTGLSEKSIVKLKEIQHYNKRSAHSDIISTIIENPNCEYFLALIGQSISYTLNHQNSNPIITFDLDGSEMEVIKKNLIDSVLQTHLLQDLPNLAFLYSQKYQKIPDQRKKEYKDHMKPIQEKLFSGEISEAEYISAETNWLNKKE